MTQAIRLTRDKMTIVDDDVYEQLKGHSWYALKGASAFYAARRQERGLYPRILLMHRWIMNAPDGLEVDHINGDSLDNRRENLRLATKAQNSANRRVFLEDKVTVKRTRGVRFRRNKWIAEIKEAGKTKSLGSFTELEDAQRAYDREAIRIYGEFATLNFPSGDPKNGVMRRV